MKSRIILGALIAATIVPVSAASAQNRELRRDRQEIRHEQRDMRHAERRGDHRDVRHERRDMRHAQREYREDWRDYRNRHRDRYHARAFDAPFRHQRFAVGVSIAPNYWARPYRINDVSRWNLPRADRNMVYVRHYDDLLLVNTRNGRVVRVYDNFFW